MINKTQMIREQILATDTSDEQSLKEFSYFAGEVLQPEKNQHELVLGRYGGYSFDTCKKCSKETQRHKNLKASYQAYDALAKEVCPVIDPVPITWEEAMKWRDWAVEKNLLDWTIAKDDVYRKETGEDPDPDSGISGWFEDFAKPEHYIKVAMICMAWSKI